MPLLRDYGPRLTLEEFRLLRDRIRDFCGISLGDDARMVVGRRLRDRLKALGHRSFTEYYQYLRFHPNAQTELERAAELLTTNETYFFREDYQLRAFRRDVLPALRAAAVERGDRRLTIWSAGCSSGEEPYTLAIIVAHSGLFDGWDVRIFGNDISRRVLHTARRAVYGGASFRVMPSEYDAYFDEAENGRQVKAEIRAMCHFGHLNLLDRNRSAIVGSVDAVFCRNVLIYFDIESRQRVIQAFYDRLHPGGYLMLGHSESLLNLSTAFELAHVTGDLVYRKPFEGAT